MANHSLSLEVPTVMNSCILKIFDTSVYSDLLPITCPTLNITVPGFGYSIQLDVTPNFFQTITACDLQLQTQDCGTQYAEIPDGIYIIKYSVSPNDIVYVEYNHLRITKALIKYQKILCDLDVAACAPSTALEKKMKQMRDIWFYLQYAKAKVEECHEPQKGMSMYNYAIKLLNKMECINC